MDINLLIMLLVFSWVPVIIGFMGKKAGWALIGFFGVTICMMTTLVVGADATITQVCGTSTCPLASANGNFISDFNIVGYGLPISIGFAEAFVIIRRAFHI